MKKLIITALAALTMAVPVMAEGNITVIANGTEIADKGVIIEERTMVPVRGVFENFGFEVTWNGDTKTATLTQGNVVVEMTNGNSYFTINGQEITPDVPQQIVDSRFMLPLRAVGEAIGANVDWNGDTKTATLSLDVAITDPSAEVATEATTEASTEATTAENTEAVTYIPGITIVELDPDNMGEVVNDIVFE